MSLKSPRDSASSTYGSGVRDVPGSFSDYTRREGQKYGSTRRRVTGSVLVICAVVSVLVVADYWANAGTIFGGVTVGDVDLGGKTSEEARNILEERGANAYDEIRFTGGPDEKFALTAEEMGLGFDVSGTVDKAYAFGREGGVPERVGDRMKAAWGTVRIPPAVDYERETVRTRIENLTARVNQKPKDASVNILGSEAKVAESREGYTVNVEATLANVDEALDSMSDEVGIAGETLEPEVSTPAAQEAAGVAGAAVSRPALLTADGEEWEFSPEEIGQSLSFTPRGNGELRVGLDREQLRESLSDVYDDLTTEPVEAGFEIREDEVYVTKSRMGKGVDEEALFDGLESGLFDGQREFEVPVVTAEPDLTTEEAEKLKPTERIGQYRTDYTLSSDKSVERVENLDIASKAISGKILAPGEVFSFNELAAPLNYNETKVIVGGKEDYADGGGLCQVSSTLYMAANYAGLDIVERTPHSAMLPYIRPGLDATVWFGSLDMKFENTTDGYVLIREYVADDGYVYAEIWGRPTGREVEMSSEMVSATPDSATWVTYQEVKEDGKVDFDGVLHEDTYYALETTDGEVVAPGSFTPAPVDP